MSSDQKRIYLDMNVLIKMVENVDDQLIFLIEQASADYAALFTSEIALSEVLVKPIRDNDRRIILFYEEMFDDPDFLDMIPIMRPVVRRSAEIRETTGNKGLDAIHLACAEAASCEIFLSSDARIRMTDGLIRVSLDTTLGDE